MHGARESYNANRSSETFLIASNPIRNAGHSLPGDGCYGSLEVRDMKMKCALLSFLLWSSLGSPNLFGIDNLKLNPQLDYGSDSLDGPLITGDDLQSGFLPGKPNYVIIYGEGCFNSKRQARRTVELYSKYRSSVHFVAIDLDVPDSPEQQQLVRKYYKGYIPHVVVLDAPGKLLYNQSGEIESSRVEAIFKNALHP
jgi:hypothetical protein